MPKLTEAQQTQPTLEVNPNLSRIISPQLQAALDSDATMIGTEPLSRTTANELIESAISNLQSVKLPYHNRDHTERVVRRSRKFGNAVGLSEHEQMLLEIAAAFHDYGHCGSTYRQLLDTEDSGTLSNEEYAAMQADTILAEKLSPSDRLTIQGMILATSFGQSNMQNLPKGTQELLFRPYKPVSTMEKLLAFADVSNFLDGFDTFIQDNLNVIAESPESGIPADFEDFLKTRLGFLGYVEMKLDDVAKFLEPGKCAELRNSLAELREQIVSLAKSPERESNVWAGKFYTVRTERLEILQEKG